jgi:AsmA protein
MKNTLTGEARFSILDGSYNNDNLAQILGQASSFLPTQPLKTAQQQGGVTFSELRGTLAIENGLISNQDLSGKSSLALIHGAGTVNLIENTIDYGIEASLTKAAIDPNSSALSAAQDYTLPIHIHGPLNDFALQADFSELAGAQIKKELEKRNIKLGKKLEKQLREKLSNEAGDLLEHFLKF